MVEFTSIWSASDSIWLKSGFSAVSTVTADEIEYFPPSEGSPWMSLLSKPESASSASERSPVWKAMNEGSSSMPRPGWMPRMPCTVPHWQGQHSSLRSRGDHT